MTAPVFDPTKVRQHSYFIEVISESTETEKVSRAQGAPWPRIDDDPIAGLNPDLRYWTNVFAPDEDWSGDARYDFSAVYDFVQYDPPTAPGYPHGERQERVVATLKSKDNLKAAVLAVQAEKNLLLWPNDGIADKIATAINIRLQSAVTDPVELAFLADFDARCAAMKLNEKAKNALFDAIEAEEDFNLDTGVPSHQWITSI